MLDVIINIMSRIVSRNGIDDDFDLTFNQAGAATTRDLIATIYCSAKRLLPLIDIEKLKYDHAEQIRQRVSNNDYGSVRIQQMIENYTVMSNVL